MLTKVLQVIASIGFLLFLNGVLLGLATLYGIQPTIYEIMMIVGINIVVIAVFIGVIMEVE